MTATTSSRIESLCQITGGKAEWYDTHAKLTRAEVAANVVWDGNLSQHVPATPGRPIKCGDGSWARPIHGSSRVAFMTERECLAAGLTPGAANYGDRT